MTNISISRRNAIGALAGGAALAAFDIGPVLAYGTHVRENITTFAANPTKLAALKTGVQVMKQRSATNPDDPTGWNYWASSHGTPNPVPAPLANIYNQCKHGSPYFYPWHRAFLYYFEQVLRGASGDPTFNLPYWNWYSQPTIPAAFTTPADTTNPLYHPRENNTVGTLSQSPFTRHTFYSAPPPPPWPGFSGDLEVDPHGAVHDDVGGDMGSIDTSAIDPIFWLHHCNVDRLWNVWINQGNSNPAPSDPWSSQPFSYNVSGTMTKKAGQVTNTASMLGYKYDRENSPLTGPIFHVPWQIVLATVLVAKPIPLPGPGPVEKNVLALAAQRHAQVASALTSGLSLGARSAQVDFHVDDPSRNRIRAFAASPTQPTESTDITLVLDGVEIAPAGERGGYSYRVCVGALPADPSEEQIERQCVAQFGSFEISVAQGHGMAGMRKAPVMLRFPLGGAIKALGAKAVGDSVPVTFVARHAKLRAGQGDQTYVTVKSAHLEFGGGL
jgi:tyrosinase